MAENIYSRKIPDRKPKPEYPSIKCPDCGMVSYNPNDIRERYCGNCHVYW